MVGPTKCIEHNPTSQTVRFAGQYINLSEIARSINMTHSHLSRIFSGVSGYSVKTLIGMSTALGMSTDDFILAMETHLNSQEEQPDPPTVAVH